MSEAAPAPERRKLLIKLALAAAALAVLGVAVLLGVDVRGLIEQGLAMIRGAGPLAFFACMALLPSVGVPLLTFLLPALASFGERLGTGTVVALCLAAATFNFMLSYALARWLMRPAIRGLLERLGFRMPEAKGSDATDLLIIMRVTPGVPFLIQNYLAGLADIPLGRYLVISCLISHPYSVAFLFFGDAILHGKGKVFLVVLGLIVALVAATHMVRRHYAGRARKAA